MHPVCLGNNAWRLPKKKKKRKKKKNMRPEGVVFSSGEPLYLAFFFFNIECCITLKGRPVLSQNLATPPKQNMPQPCGFTIFL